LSIDSVIHASAAESVSLALVERAQTGDPRAFEALLQTRFWRLDRLALSITANEADARDALQDACLRAWQQLPRLRDPSRFDVWLWRIVLNSCRSQLRGRRRVRVHEIAIEDGPTGDRRMASERGLGDALSENDAIQRAFQRLDMDKRAILILHHVEERSVGDIAQLLGIPEGTAKWRLHSARQALDRALQVERR
jgi:RNA polymerase sigma-70 factor (ECF subfamily)